MQIILKGIPRQAPGLEYHFALKQKHRVWRMAACWKHA
uniref:Uncharacterized protein n=1 Tax=Rhizophora mucronata TaxID=61149 RepID=A0A2P2QE80_RHIMU